MPSELSQPTPSNNQHPVGAASSTAAGQGLAAPETPTLARSAIAHASEGEFSARLGVRLPAVDADAWRAAAHAARLSLSDWLRLAVQVGADSVGPTTGRSTPGRRQPDLSKRRYTQVDPALLAALARLGNGVNQVARQLNSAAYMGDQMDVLSAARSLKAIESEALAFRKFFLPETT